MATLARFRAGLRPEFQRELVLQEVSTLEKAYRYTLNMELYATHSHKSHAPWIATPENTRYAPTVPRNPLSTLQNPVIPQITPPPSRLFLPSPSTIPTIPPSTTTTTAGGQLGAPLGPPSNRISTPPSIFTQVAIPIYRLISFLFQTPAPIPPRPLHLPPISQLSIGKYMID